MQLLDWLEQVTFPEEKKYSDVEYARRVYSEVVGRTLNAGVKSPRVRCISGSLMGEADHHKLLLRHDAPRRYDRAC